MIKDNGKISIEIRDGIPIIEVYHNGEIGLADVVWINRTLLKDIEPPIQLPADIIIDRTGSYCLSEDAYMNMQNLMKESKHVAYVVHTPAQGIVVDYAANSYLADKKVGKFSSIEDAFKWLQQSSRGSKSENLNTAPSV